MRILYHHRTLGDGAEGIHISEMVKALSALGHEVRVLSLIGEKTNANNLRQRRWTRVARLMPGLVYELGEIFYNFTGYARLRGAIRDFRPDAVYDRYVSYNYSAVAAARRSRIPVIVEVNSPYSVQRQTFDERVYFKKLIRWFERVICRDADAVIAVSSPLKQVLMSLGVPDQKIMVLSNGVDPEAFRPDLDASGIRSTLGLDGKIVVGFSGILRPWHGLELLVRAFAHIVTDAPRPHLLIIGDGPSRASIEAEVRNLGLASRVTFTGRLPHGSVAAHVAATDIAISPRATFYSSPMKILEYMAMAKTVVAPDMPNIRDLVRNGENGILFNPEDPEDLARKLKMLIEDAPMRERLGRRAREWVVAERTWEHNARVVVRMIEGLRGQEADSAVR